jgi:hypothetical protein
VFNHGTLHLGQFALLGQSFYGMDFPARHQGEEHQTTIDWKVCASSAVLTDHDYGACSAFAFRAPLFGPSQPLSTEKVEERGVQTTLGLHTFPVQLKFDNRAGLATR